MAEGCEENIKQMMESPSKENNIFKSSCDPSQICEEAASETNNTESSITGRNDEKTSKLGNGDCFHNPENLVQFVVSGIGF